MVDQSQLEKLAAGAMRDFPFYPELGKLTRGKVRDNYERDGRIVSIATDRVSAFDKVMKEPIPLKGQVLTEMATYWFDTTTDIMPNHMISHPDPQVVVVRKCTPFDVEFIIRGYITGSAWRDYAGGARVKSGIPLAEGLKKNQQFDPPIITNTTKAKEGHDLDITRNEIFERKLLTPQQLEEAEDCMRMLYARGVELAGKQGFILVDTKFEMGLDANGVMTLIDEVLTPDSSRYWEAEPYQQLFSAGQDQRELSKEFLRAYLLSIGFKGDKEQEIPSLPLDVVVETAQRYADLYEKVTGKQLVIDSAPVKDRIAANLRKAGLLTGGYVQIIAGSEGDAEHYNAIIKHLQSRGVPCSVEVLSAHKNTRKLLGFLEQMSTSAEPVVYIAVAGRSNALGGVIASEENNPRGFPVINCPSFKDAASYQVDIHSSLRMPSKIPALTVLEPENAAIAAYNMLKMAGAQFKKAA